jgi:molybdenum cofactor cytidylyltransferase
LGDDPQGEDGEGGLSAHIEGSRRGAAGRSRPVALEGRIEVRFGAIDLAEAEGAILAHGVRTAQGALKKGRRLDASDIAALAAAGITRVMAARPEHDDVLEDEAAAALARALAGPCLTAAEPFTGRANLFAAQPGLVVLDRARIDRINRIDEAITVATLPPFAPVAARDMVATIKIIPFAAPRASLDHALEAARGPTPAIAVAAFRPIRAALVQTRLPGTADKMLEKTVAVTRDRVAQLGGTLLDERRCPHEVEPLATAIRASLAAGPELVLIASASAITDRRDVVPAAILAAGGVVEHFGMPVDPGNLILTGRIGSVPVLGLPGCARSPKLNGFDWVLQRLAAGLQVTPDDIMGMGVGGLLSEIRSRPQPREAAVAPPRAPRIGAVLLAAGRSSRMGERNKLLVPIDGRPLVRHAAEALLASQVERTVVVTGHMAEAVEAALADLPLDFARNPSFTTGMSSSLRAGLDALPPDLDGVLVALGDMPRVSARLIDRMIAAFSPQEGRAIVVPTAARKRGNPVLFASAFIEPIRRLQGDVGARAIVAQHEDVVVEIESGDDAPLIDVDTPEALGALAAAPAAS